MKKTVFGKISTLLCALLSLVMIFSLAACGDDNGDGSFKLDKTTGEVDVGSSSLTIMAQNNDDNAVEWKSSDVSVATVAPMSPAVTIAGRVTGVSIGTAVITATAGGKTATCTVTVTAPETISITKDGTTAPANISLTKGDTAQLGATSSKGHNIVWQSSSDLIATVSQTGLVTAVASSGTATITAKCGGTDNNTSEIAKSITVTIGSGIDSAYQIGFATEAEANAAPGLWKYWNEFDNVLTVNYNEGTASISFENNGANWYNVQLFYTPSATDKDTAGAAITAGTLYKVDFDVNSDTAGKVTVNGNIITLAEGSNHYSVYYVHSVTGFTMAFGYQNDTPSGGWDLVNAAVSVSNVRWTVATPIKLTAPTFSITNNVITINDSNPAGSVSGYTLVIYDGTTVKGELAVTNGATIDAAAIRPSGTYTAKLKAIAANPGYTGSDEATSSNNTVTVVAASYELPFVQGTAAIGSWAYWTSSWVVVNTKTCSGEDVVTLQFNNNAGWWYDMQLKYKTAGKKNGDTYTLKVHINVSADGSIGDGKVTINNTVHNLVKGDNVISVNITENSGNSLQILFGVVDENDGKQCIQAATVTVYVEKV